MNKTSIVSIAKLIEAHIEKNEYKFSQYANFIASQYDKHGFKECAFIINDAIECKTTNEYGYQGPVVELMANMIVSHVSQNEEAFINNADKLISFYESAGEYRKAKILKCRIDGSYKDMPKAVVLDFCTNKWKE